LLYIAVITTYNVAAIFITQLLESVWRSILENFRPIAVWGADLVLFYLVTHGSFGEAWLGGASFLQVPLRVPLRVPLSPLLPPLHDGPVPSHFRFLSLFLCQKYMTPGFLVV
jgi:hypothetical protein